MTADRRAILALIAMGRITPAEAERLIAAWDESRETAWILAVSFGFAALAQFRMHDLMLVLKQFAGALIPAFMQMFDVVIGGVGGLL